MSINEISAGNWWNYTQQQGENYKQGIQGEIIEIAEVHSYDNRKKELRYWPANPMTGIANPVLDLRFRILQQDGSEILHSMNPKGPEARTLQAAYKQQFGKGLVRWSDLIGEIVAIATTPGNYGQNNPRPWTFQFLGKGTHGGEYVEFDYSKLTQQQAQPMQQPQAYQGQPYMQPPAIAQPQGFYQQPQPQAMPMSQPMPQQQMPMANPFQQQQQPMPMAQAAAYQGDPYNQDDIPF